MKFVFYLKMYLPIFFIFSPIFISFGKNGILGFDRVGGISNEYYITFPLSLAVIIILFYKYKYFIIRDKVIVIFLNYSIPIICLSYLYNQEFNFSLLKTLILMNLFLLSIKAFKCYFHKNYSGIEACNLLSKVVFWNLAMILILTIFSWYFIEKYSFIFSKIKIYNFEQYFSLTFIPLIVYFRRKNNLVYLVFCFFLFLISFLSVNYTSIIITLTLIIFIEFFYYTNLLKYDLTYNLFLSFIVITPLIWLLLLSQKELSYLPNNLIYRVNMITNYFDNIKWYQVVLPFLHEPRSVFMDMHNEVLEIFNAVGIIGIILYYYYVIKHLINYKGYFRYLGISISLIIFMGGITVEPTLHSYTLIILAFFIALFSHSSTIFYSNDIYQSKIGRII